MFCEVSVLFHSLRCPVVCPAVSCGVLWCPSVFRHTALTGSLVYFTADYYLTT